MAEENQNEPEVLENEGGEEVDDRHQVAHSDNPDAEDPKKVAITHWILAGLSFFGMAAILIGGWMLFVSFEGKLQERRVLEAEQQRLDALTVPTLKGEVFYYRDKNSAKTYLSTSGEEVASQEIYDGAILPYNSERNPTWQISANGYTVLYQTGKSKIKVHRVNDEFEITMNQEIVDWQMSENGRLVAIHTRGGQNELKIYDLAIQSVVKEDKKYINGLSGQISRLHYGNDAVVRHFAITGSEEMTVYEFDVHDGAAEKMSVFTSRRLGGGELLKGGISPDGSQVIHKYIKDGSEWLGITSLNSGTIRDVYRPPNSASRVTEATWAKDSRTLAFTEAENGRIVRLVVLDTGPTTYKVVADQNKEGLNGNVDIAKNLQWQDDGTRLAFTNGKDLILMTIEGQNFEKIESGPISNPYQYGWYYR